ncbi:winged helix-turn-helix domain-containing protein [Haloglomus litoreum]|uniref:winged helix-turn-helix domain-containing protein n=1 Tax=Haloglomus litoreum TaxID=3034026 RepID=UPI0023E83A4C|nr:winged helix-turn-helix domain-containing protein [Haloglomus sp. DT116]
MNDWDEVSYVISSRYRVLALRRLAESPATPSQIAREGECSIAHASRALQELRDHGLVDLLVSESRQKGRVYGVTDQGRATWDTIEKENLA